MNKCDWCDSDKFKGMVSGVKIPIVCKDCGTNLGHIDVEEFNRILRELELYKKILDKSGIMVIL